MNITFLGEHYIFGGDIAFWSFCQNYITLVGKWLELATDLLVCNNVQQLLMQQLMQQLLMHYCATIVNTTVVIALMCKWIFGVKQVVSRTSCTKNAMLWNVFRSSSPLYSSIYIFRVLSVGAYILKAIKSADCAFQFQKICGKSA